MSRTFAPGLGKSNCAPLRPRIWLIAAAVTLVAACSGADGGSSTNSSGGYTSGMSLASSVDLAATGPPGGPFAPGGSYSLSNTGNQALTWSASASEPWINLSPTFGFIQSGETVVITATASGPAADALPPGGYSGTITFSDNADPNADIVAAANLTVEDAFGMSVTPPEGFSAGGDPGGPFTPDTKTYTITNTSPSNVTWQVSLSDNFVVVQGADNGVLTPGQSADVTLALDLGLANGFASGLYSASATFTNVGTAEVFAGRDVRLTVLSTVAGWTEFTPSVDTRVIYVSNSGNDSNDGLSPATPKSSIAAGKALVRDGFPDWLLLERGSTWSGQVGSWSASGRSSAEMALLGDYGDPGLPRPRVNGSGNNLFGFSTNGGNGVRHAAVVGIHFFNGDFEGLTVEDILIENCRFVQCNLRLRTSASYPNQPPRNVRLRRCVIQDAGPSGILTNEAQDFLFEEVIFYNNGLDDDVREHHIYMSGRDPDSSYTPGTGGNQSNGNTVRGCFFLQAGGNFAIKWRVQDNGLIERNVFSRNRNGVEIHTKWPDELAINNTFRENVMVDQGNPSTASGVHGLILNGVLGATVTDNIFARNDAGSGGGNPAINLLMPNRESEPEEAGNPFPSPRNVLIERNIVYDWTGTELTFGNAAQGNNEYSGIEVMNNDFQSPITTNALIMHSEPIRLGTNGVSYSGNRYYRPAPVDRWYEVNGTQMAFPQWETTTSEGGADNNQVGYSDPGRDLGTYAVDMGLGSSYQDLANLLIQQEKGNWNPDLDAEVVINYIRGGYDLAPLP